MHTCIPSEVLRPSGPKDKDRYENNKQSRPCLLQISCFLIKLLLPSPVYRVWNHARRVQSSIRYSSNVVQHVQDRSNFLTVDNLFYFPGARYQWCAWAVPSQQLKRRTTFRVQMNSRGFTRISSGNLSPSKCFIVKNVNKQNISNITEGVSPKSFFFDLSLCECSQ